MLNCKVDVGHIHIRSKGSLLDIWLGDPVKSPEAEYLLTICSTYGDELIEALQLFRDRYGFASLVNGKVETKKGMPKP